MVDVKDLSTLGVFITSGEYECIGGGGGYLEYIGDTLSTSAGYLEYISGCLVR